ncbi:MAG: RluA family pseudouridine synthase [Clostridia bacterium]|nr:RluA family pseudouridine synthase [Clostridia bacterium]
MNGVKVGADCTLKPHDEVAYYMTSAQEEKRAFSVIYEDENVIVIDKESGVNSEAVFAELCTLYESPQGTQAIYFIHRLDRNTQGIMIFGRTMSASEELKACFREQRAEKIYHALVFGKMPKPHETCTAYLFKDEKSSFVKIFPQNKRASVKIVTEYEVLETREETSLLKITLHTGKTHQIRAHMAFLGHPVVGDEKYGDHVRNKRLHFTRQRLIAKSLTLQRCGALAYLNGRTFTSEKDL